MAQTYSDKKGNQHPTYAAAQMANVTIDATDEAKKHTKLLENQNIALADQARQQAKAQKRQNELAEEALELERERAAEEAEHRGKLERIEQERLQSDKDHARFQRDVMVLESATDEERFEFFVGLEVEDVPTFWNSLSYSYLNDRFKKNPELGDKYRELSVAIKEKAKSVAGILNEFHSLQSRADTGTRFLGFLSLLFYLGTACFLTNCSINKALLGGKTEAGEQIQPWGEEYFIGLLILIVGGLWFFLKNSVSVRNMARFDKTQLELTALRETHGDPAKIQMDFEQFAQANVEERKNLIIGVLTEVHLGPSEEEKQSIAGRVQRLLKDRSKDYPRRCRPSDEYLSDAERLFGFFSEGWTKSDLLTLECGIAHEYADSVGGQTKVEFVRIGYAPKMAENFLKGAGYVVAA